MAKKKFSRLSVMLQATDRMSKPMLQAAKASESLQRSVQNLDSKMGQSSIGVDKVNRATKNATNSMTHYAQVVKRAVQESALAYVTNKALKATYTMLTNAAYNTSYALKDIGIKALTAFKNTSMFMTVSSKFLVLQNGVKLLSRNMLELARNTKVYQASTAFIRSISNAYNIVNQSVTSHIAKLRQNVVETVRNSQAYKMMSAAVDVSRRKIIESAVSFTLWKNSSVFVQKLRNDFNNVGRALSFIGNGVKRLIPNFKGLRNNIDNSNRSMEKLSKRRATFNQLADANARLNREIAKMNAQLAKSDSRLGKIRGGIGSLNHMGAAFGLAYAGQAAARTAGRGIEATVGGAMQQQFNEESVGILAGAENGAKYWKQIQDYASTTAYAASDWAQSMRGAIGRSKSVEDLEKYQLAMEQLATLDPVQGLEGAALAIRELNSGDAMSLVRRFELPRKALNEFKNLSDPIEQLDKLMKVVGESTGFTIDAIQDMKKLPLMQWQKFTNQMRIKIGQIGKGSLEIIAPMLEDINKAIGAGKFDAFVKSASAGLAKVTKNVIKFVQNIIKYFKDGSLKKKFEPFINLFNNIKDTIIQAWPNISAVLDNGRKVLGNVADMINSKWPTINNVIQTSLGYIRQWSDFIVTNWPVIISLIGGVVAGFAAFKIIGVITTLWSGLTKVVALYRAGLLIATVQQWAMNTAMMANPIGLVIALIAGLVTAGILLYKNWDVVKEKLGNLWEGIKWAFGKIGEAISTTWYYAKKAVFDGINFMIEKINKLITTINKIPGVEIPIIPKIEDPDIPDHLLEKEKGKGHAGGLSNVPYDGYMARLHKGERVLTNEENKDYNKGLSSVLVSGNTFIVRKDSDIDDIADKLFEKLQAAKVAMG